MKPFHLLLATAAVNHFVFSGCRLAVLLQAVHLGTSPAVVGLLTALFAALGVTTSVATGRWVDRIGPRDPMLYSSLLMAAGAATAFVWPGLAALFVVSTVVGTLYNVYFIGNQQQVGRHGRPEDRIGNFSLNMQIFSGASFAAPLVTGLAIDHMGYAYTFLLLAVLPLIPALIIGADKLPFVAEPRSRATATAGAIAASPSRSVWDLLRIADLRRIFIVALLTHVGWNLYTFLMPVYGAQIALSASQIGMVVSAFSLAAVIVRSLTAMMARHLTAWQVMLISLLIASAGLIATPLFSNLAILLVLAALLGMSLGVGAPMSLSLMYYAAPPGRIGEVLGLRLSMINGLQTVVPLSAGAIGAAVGVGPVFWALAAILVAGTWVTREQWHAPRAKHGEQSAD